MRAAIILCAGLGTRLRPLSDWAAKPIVPVGDRAQAGHVAARLRAAGIARIAVNVHHRPEDLRGWAEAEEILVSHEPELLGTAGGITQAWPLVGDEDVVVWNGDIACDLDVAALVAAHERAGAAATLAVVVHDRPGAGKVGLDPEGRVVRLRERAFGEEARGADFIGIRVLGRELAPRFPARGCFVEDVLVPALERGEPVVSHAVTTPWVDIGSLEGYLAANRAWLGERPSWAAPDARVEARIDGSVVGAGAIVEAAAQGSVVWPGARVTTPVARAVVTPFGTVTLGA